jgi:glycogen debranching enzyme
MDQGTQFLNLLKDQIDIAHVPFSARGSRLLLYRERGQSLLLIKLAERLIYLDPHPEAYIRRRPFIHNLGFVDENGALLDFAVTTSPEELCFHTRLGDFRLAFQDNHTLAIGLPPGQSTGIKFHVHPEMWIEADSGGEIKSVRNFAYRTNGEVIRNKVLPTLEGYSVEFSVSAAESSTVTLRISSSFDLAHEPLPYSDILEESKDRWLKWFNLAPPVAEVYRQTYAYAWWVLGCNLLSPLGTLSVESTAPSKSTYIGIWLWDSAFHAIAYRHVNPALARDQIRAMLAHQLPNGMVPDAIHDEGIVTEIDHPIRGEVTKPPILAWASLKIHQSAPDLEFLKAIYNPFVRLNYWWFEFNDDDKDGLAQYNHPYSSGLDDSPLWDHGMPVESPDINTYLCIQMQALAEIAEALGLPEEAVDWKARADEIVQRMIEDFWDEEAGLFRTTYDKEPIPVVTPFGLIPLWSGALPEKINRRLIGHLKDPGEFWGEHVLPTVARNDPAYDPDTMWRGPVWANINYIFIEALKRVGEDELANELREKTLTMIMGQQGIFEYYNAETGVAPRKAGGMFSWTAAVFIDLAIQASRNLEDQKEHESDSLV